MKDWEPSDPRKDRWIYVEAAIIVVPIVLVWGAWLFA